MGRDDQTAEDIAAWSLGSRLQAVRRRSFVGRFTELELFRSALTENPPPFAVLFVHGPGGVGKSALLRRMEQEARSSGRDVVVLLDGRDVEPSAEGFLSHLGMSPGIDEPGDVMSWLGERGPPVLLIDTYERLGPLDGWLREKLIPQLPMGTVVVIAGRAPPSTGWRADPGWQDLLRVVSLRDLDPDDARALLAARGVVGDRHDDVLRFARGHPLALVLLADVLAQEAEGTTFSLEQAPDVIAQLLDRFVREVPTEAHQEALAVSAHAGVATQALIRDAVDGAPPRQLFDWLRQLSFSEEIARGVTLHEIVRETLDADLRWRDPERYADMHRRVARHLSRRVTRTAGRSQQQAMLDMLQLYRFSPSGSTFFAWDATADQWLEPSTPDDHDAILAMTAQHEGERSAEIARWWLARQPEAFQVFRTAGSAEPLGFVCHLLLSDEPEEETSVDPVAATVWEHVRATAPLRGPESIRLMRFWIDRHTYQDVATHHLVSSRAALDWMTTAGLAWSFVALADPDFWEPIFRLIDFGRLGGATVSVDDHQYGLFVRDWRLAPRDEWLEVLHDRQLAVAGPADHGGSAQPRLLVLSHDQFTEAVRDALRSYGRADGLANSPLLRSRVVVERAGDRAPTDVLVELLDEAAGELSAHPRDEKRLRALELTYFKPAPTQEAAAERLGQPFSTFRRHLTAGVEHVVDWLWQREVHGQPHLP